MTRIIGYAAGAFFPRLYALAAVFIFSRLLSVHDFGLYALAQAIGDFCEAAAGTWFRTGMVRFYHRGAISSAPNGLNLTPLLLVDGACKVIAICMTWVAAAILVPGAWHYVAFAASLYVIGFSSAQTALGIFRGEERPGLYAAMEALRPAVALGMAVLAIHVWGANFLSCAAALFGSQALVGMAAWLVVWSRHSRGTSTNTWIRGILHYGWPLAVCNMLAAFVNFADRSQLQFWIGATAVATYSVAYTVSRQPIEMLFVAFNLGAFSELSKVRDTNGVDAASALLSRQITALLFITLPGVVGVIALATPLVHVLFDSRYWATAPAIVPIIAIAALINGITNYGINQAFHMTKRTGPLILIYVITMTVTFGTAVAFVRHFGLPGAAYAVLLGSTAGLFFSTLLVFRSVPLPLQWLELSRIFAASIAMMAMLHLLASLTDSLLTLVVRILVGVIVYTIAVIAFDTFGLRRILRQRLLGNAP